MVVREQHVDVLAYREVSGVDTGSKKLADVVCELLCTNARHCGFEEADVLQAAGMLGLRFPEVVAGTDADIYDTETQFVSATHLRAACREHAVLGLLPSLPWLQPS